MMVCGGSRTMQRNQPELHERLLLNVCDVAQLLGIGRNLAYELVRQNRLPHIRLGRRILIPREALWLWLEKESSIRTAEAAPAASH